MALCRPLAQMYTYRMMASRYWEMALAAADPLQEGERMVSDFRQ